MSLRTSDRALLIGALALLGACQQSQPSNESANTAAPAAPSTIEAMKAWIEGEGEGEADHRRSIYCAFGAKARLAEDCRIEAVTDKQGRILILSRPDGGFRRVRVGKDGSLSPADGAIGARMARGKDAAGIIFGEERYAVPLDALGIPAP